jgi:5-methylcytosine-specific restriction endonuclease McrBC regulatory subunit McrC
MNRLYEQFVQRAFENVSRRSKQRIAVQEWHTLSLFSPGPKFKPDVIVWSGDSVTAIADAKYKRDFAMPPNSDMYQVITYGTVLDCGEVYLLYPQTEIDFEREFPIANSPIVVKTRKVDIASPNAVASAEALARSILAFGDPVVAVGAA